VSAGKTIRRIGWRLGICLLLLVWIFHVIFMTEGGLAWQGPPAWAELSRSQQWRIAWETGPPQLWGNLTAVDPFALILSFLVMGLTLLIGVARWMIALRVQGLNLPWSRALGITFIAHFFNSFLLGSTGGDLMKAYYAAGETAHKKTEAVVTVFVDRVIGLWSMLLFALAMVAFNFDLLRSHKRLQLLMLVILGMLIVGTGFVVPAFWAGLSNRWTGAREWLQQLPKGKWIGRSLDSCREFGRSKRFFFKMVLVSTVLNLVCVLQYIILARGLNIAVPVSVWMLIVPSIICISALPITPSGLGVRENLYVAILAATPFLIPETSALALSLLAYAGSLFWSLVGGGVYLFLKDRQHLEEVTESGPE